MKITPPADAPPWARTFARDTERAIRGPRDAPVRLPPFANAAALPAAADWPYGIVYVADIAMAAISTGSAWKRLDTGATL